MYQTTVIALSASAVKKFRSDEPYVVIQITDPGSKHPYLHPRPPMKARMGVYFDDVLPEEANDPTGFQRYIAMNPEQAERMARFVKMWWGKVATVVVHCHAGLSRSVGTAIAIREYYAQPFGEFYEAPKTPNAHCRDLVSNALAQG